LARFARWQRRVCDCLTDPRSVPSSWSPWRGLSSPGGCGGRVDLGQW